MKTTSTLAFALTLTACQFDAIGEASPESSSSSDDGTASTITVTTTSAGTTTQAESSSGSSSDESSSGSDPSETTDPTFGEDATTTGAPVTDWALAFDGNNAGVTPLLPGLPSTYTVEFWLRSGPNMHGSFLYTAAMDPTARGWYFIHDDPPGGGLAFTNVLVYINYDERPQWEYVVGMDLRAQVGWHHIAVTKTIDGLVRMWVDGGMVAEYQFGAPFAVSERPLTIGPSLSDAQIDDVRISDVVRYEALFEPPQDMSADADTLYMWRLDEGDGTVAMDDVEGIAFELPDPIWVER